MAIYLTELLWNVMALQDMPLVYSITASEIVCAVTCIIKYCSPSSLRNFIIQAFQDIITLDTKQIKSSESFLKLSSLLFRLWFKVCVVVTDDTKGDCGRITVHLKKIHEASVPHDSQFFMQSRSYLLQNIIIISLVYLKQTSRIWMCFKAIHSLFDWISDN